MQSEKPVWKILNVIIIPLIIAIIGVAASLWTHYDAKHSTESKIVAALSERYESVDREMSYEQALGAVDRDIGKLKSENSQLQSDKDKLQLELSTKQGELDEVNSAFAYSDERSTKIELAKSYADQGDYGTAIPILNSIVEKTEDVTAILKDYIIKYEAQIVSAADNLMSKQQFEEAVNQID